MDVFELDTNKFLFAQSVPASQNYPFLVKTIKITVNYSLPHYSRGSDTLKLTPLSGEIGRSIGAAIETT